MIKNFFLIRHAESTGNVDCQEYVKTPCTKVGLTDKGKEQAKTAGQSLAKMIAGPDAGVHGDYWRSTMRPMFFSSPCDRAIQTAQIINEELHEKSLSSDCQIKQDVLLSEQNWGAATGFGSIEDFLAHLSENFTKADYYPVPLIYVHPQQTLFKDLMTSLYYRFPQGESLADVAVRAEMFLSKIVTLRCMNVVAVSHMGTCNMIQKQGTGEYGDLEEWGNAEIRWYQIYRNRHGLISLNLKKRS